MDGALVLFPLQSMGVSLVRVRETGNPGELWGCCTVGRTTTICLSDYSINSWQAAWSCHFVRVFWAKSLEPCSFYVTEIGRWYRKLFFKILYVKWICSHAFLTMGGCPFVICFILCFSFHPLMDPWPWFGFSLFTRLQSLCLDGLSYSLKDA